MRTKEEAVAMNRMKLIGEIRKWLEDDAADVLREMLRLFAESLMGAEADQMCGAEHGSRSPDRVNHRNGYRERRWDTRVGTIDLRIPKLRRGSYFPHFLLEPRRRSERALVSVIAECYVNGVSTRKVERLAEALGIVDISKSQVAEMAKSLDAMVEEFRSRPLNDQEYPLLWLDAIAIKNREGGRVVNVATVVATAVSSDGYREILGLDTFTTEDEAAWTDFLRGLVARGLKGARLVISDAHPGLVNAVGTTLTGASWQRCRTHFMTNLLAKVPKAAQGLVASLVRSIFAQPDSEQVWIQHRTIVDQLSSRFPEAAELLEEAAHDILAFTAFPKAIWRQIWSNNPQERLNKEIRRRTDVVGLFPNRDAIIRLVGALLCEQNDEWSVSRRYMSLDTMTAVLAVDNHTNDPVLPGKEEATQALAATA
jgi:transposase-like protein